MQEFTTQALVLSVEQVGEADARIALFTEQAGRLSVRAKSFFKTTSKLAGHAQPLALIEARIVEKKGAQLVDAMTLALPARFGSLYELRIALAIARLIEKLTNAYEPDSILWKLISRGSLATIDMLRVLGFDPLHARCEQCGKREQLHFDIMRTMYYCSRCAGAARSNEGMLRM